MAIPGTAPGAELAATRKRHQRTMYLVLLGNSTTVVLEGSSMAGHLT